MATRTELISATLQVLERRLDTYIDQHEMFKGELEYEAGRNRPHVGSLMYNAKELEKVSALIDVTEEYIELVKAIRDAGEEI